MSEWWGWLQRTRCAITREGQQAASVSLHLHSRAAGWWAVLTSAVKPDFSTVGSFVGYSGFSRQELCFLEVPTDREVQMTATLWSCAFMFGLPEQFQALRMWAPVGDCLCQKAVLSVVGVLMLCPPASPMTLFTPLLASPSAHGTCFLTRFFFTCLLGSGST